MSTPRGTPADTAPVTDPQGSAFAVEASTLTAGKVAVNIGAERNGYLADTLNPF